MGAEDKQREAKRLRTLAENEKKEADRLHKQSGSIQREVSSIRTQAESKQKEADRLRK
jgi:hypothetical protein